MALMDEIVERACRDPRRVLLPEAEDERVLRAAAVIEERGIGRPILVGDESRVSAKRSALGLGGSFEMVNPATSEALGRFEEELYGLRSGRGMTRDAAAASVRDPLMHAVLMLRAGEGDGLVAGAVHATADTLRPALQVLRVPRVLVSGFYFVTVEETTYLFADCAVVENPNPHQLAEIALETARSAISFGIEPRVAMLSYSTKGSARNPLIEKVVEATRIAQGRVEERFGSDSGVVIDGELQLDAALVADVAARKAPGSSVAGGARVLVFPDLNAANIGYKLVQRLGGATAYGAILQGLRPPVNDLSRGCSWEEIVGVAAVTVVQAQMMKGAESAGSSG